MLMTCKKIGKTISSLKMIKIQNLISSSFGRSTIILTTGTLIASVIGILGTTLLSRIFSPQDYGLLALFSAFISVCSTLITLRYETRIILPKANNEAKTIVAIVFIISIIFGLLLILLFATIPLSLIEKIGLGEISSWLIVAVGASIATSLITAVTNWFNRNEEYKRISILRILQALFASLFAILAGLLSINGGLIFAQLISLILILLLIIKFAHKLFFPLQSISRLIEVAVIHKRAPIYLLPTAILDVVTMQIPFFLISFWFSNAMTGYYRMAYSLLLLPASLIGSSIAQIFFQRYSKIWPDAFEAKKLLLKTWKILLLIGIIPMLIIIIFGKFIFITALGESWGEAGIMASILAPMVFVSLIHSPTSSTLTVMGHEKLGFYIALTILIYRPLAFYIGYLYHDFYLGLALFTVFEITHYILFQFMALKKINQVLKRNYQMNNYNQ